MTVTSKCPDCGVTPFSVHDCGHFGDPDCPFFGIGRDQYESNMSFINRLRTATNASQGQRTKVLCVCTSGCLRAPTAAHVLSKYPFDYNTRSCGIDQDFALIPIDEILCHWADEFVVFDSMAKTTIMEMLEELECVHKTVTNLDIADVYNYRDPELEHAIKHNYFNMR